MSPLTAINTFSASYSVINSLLYKEFIEERDEILRHKWLESEKKGYDIGFNNALFDWILKYRTSWRKYRSGK